ncbi:hypothetical protein [Lonepinella sp. BR2919]|uniref:hypothetical protein n=1 Tax=unclassified Lonepinella TaxID=2642006 RepID=UPI003F6E1D7E
MKFLLFLLILFGAFALLMLAIGDWIPRCWRAVFGESTTTKKIAPVQAVSPKVTAPQNADQQQNTLQQSLEKQLHFTQLSVEIRQKLVKLLQEKGNTPYFQQLTVLHQQILPKESRLVSLLKKQSKLDKQLARLMKMAERYSLSDDERMDDISDRMDDVQDKADEVYFEQDSLMDEIEQLQDQIDALEMNHIDNLREQEIREAFNADLETFVMLQGGSYWDRDNPVWWANYCANFGRK